VSDDLGDEEAAKLGSAGFITGIGCAVVVFLGGGFILFAIAMAMRDYQG